MDESMESKPVISEEVVHKSAEESAGDVVAEETDSRSATGVDKSEDIDSVAVSDNKESDPSDKMDVESSAVEPSDGKPLTTADSEPSVGVGDSADEERGVEPEVEPVPDVKSPPETEKALSPAPAIQSSTPPRSHGSKKPKVDLTTVPVRQYLDTTVVPILLQGLSSLARERPNKPIQYLSDFLREKASEYDE